MDGGEGGWGSSGKDNERRWELVKAQSGEREAGRVEAWTGEKVITKRYSSSYTLVMHF